MFFLHPHERNVRDRRCWNSFDADLLFEELLLGVECVDCQMGASISPPSVLFHYNVHTFFFLCRKSRTTIGIRWILHKLSEPFEENQGYFVRILGHFKKLATARVDSLKSEPSPCRVVTVQQTRPGRVSCHSVCLRIHSEAFPCRLAAVRTPRCYRDSLVVLLGLSLGFECQFPT